MAEDITPALTPKEWTERAATRGERNSLLIGLDTDREAVVLERYKQVVILGTEAERQAAAALCLIGYFTQADVNVATALARYLRGEIREGEGEGWDTDQAASLAARIAALLPPVAPEPNDQ